MLSVFSGFDRILHSKFSDLLFTTALSSWIFFMILGYVSMFAMPLQGVPVEAVRIVCLAFLLVILFIVVRGIIDKLAYLRFNPFLLLIEKLLFDLNSILIRWGIYIDIGRPRNEIQYG